MRATWITSAVAGVVFGFIATRFDVGGDPRKGAGYVTFAIFGLFFVSLFIGVIGIAQLRELRDKRRPGSSWMAHQIEDGPAFLVPFWGRMAVWFFAAGSGSFLSKAFE